MRFIFVLSFLIIHIILYPYTIKKQALDDYIDRLTLKQKIGQLFFVYSPSTLYFPVEPGGIIPSISMLKKLYNKKLENSIKHFNIPPFIAIDGEGGLVNRFSFISKFPSMYELSTLNKNSIDSILDLQILLMKESHINVNFSPVIDISYSHLSLMKKTKRSINGDIEHIYKFAEYYIKKYKKNKILCTLKHYPGYGNTIYNSDISIYNFKGNYKDFLNGFVLFSLLIPKTDFIMVSNLKYNFIDSLPAIMSNNLLKYIELYNNRMIIISDDISAMAHNNPFDVLKKSYQNGCDMFVLMNDKLYNNMIDSMIIWISNNEHYKSLLEKKVKKIILKKEYLFRIISSKQ